ncbi:amidase family protein [Paenibacillus sp. S150]|uniref:amidase family protein n=1 Tax=Paenibacillus sp. S150 TaxID=2749826 RepID=UPI001C59E0F9|nr:amidase family protein [Paenibacillus sp. S150]MBW4085211.1 amidase [Paenibacillus sp. S150]
MLRKPDVEEVKAYGKELGLNFTDLEAVLVQQSMERSLDGLDTFYEARLEEDRLPTGHFVRDPGYRPSEEEDPYNAFIRKCRVEGSGEGLLAGKTVALKDHVAVSGIPMTFGSHFMDGYTPDFDATIVTRILNQGATITGKLNMIDFSSGSGLSGTGDYGRVKNPHNPEHVSGGSSSGSAVSVASGAVDISIGGDQGGSVRAPAHYCGVIGLKPTFGLIPHTGVFGSDPGVDFLGPLAKKAEDVALMLESIAGPDGYDPRQRNIPELPAYSQIIDRGVKGLKIGILEEGIGFDGMEPEVENAVLAAIEVLSKAGAIVSRVSVPAHTDAHIPASILLMEGSRYLMGTNFGGAFAETYYPTSLIRMIGSSRQSHGYQLPLGMRTNLTTAEYLHRNYYGTLYAKAQNVRKGIRRAYDKAFADIDLLVCPTKPTRAPKFKAPQSTKEALEQAITGGGPAHFRNTSCFNYTGHPAISVPCQVDGLPIGMQLIGPHYSESLLLQAAYAYQQSI